MLIFSETLNQDAVSVAAQLGRLDFASLLLAIVGLILVGGGVFAFINFRAIAKKTAQDEASLISKEIAERIANDYMQSEGSKLVKQYVKFYIDNPSDDEADDIANAQDS